VDGFIARTFTPLDASSYLILLLRAQNFLQYYGILHHQGAWYISAIGTWCRAHHQAFRSSPLPFSTITWRDTGTVVPQRRWTPADEVDIRRHVESAALQLPIFFVNRNGGLGFRLPDILRGCDRDLHNAEWICTTRRQDHDSHPDQRESISSHYRLVIIT
jgi:hypothetical protein